MVKEKLKSLNSKLLILWAVLIILWVVAFGLLANAVDLKEIIKQYAVGWGTLALINAGLAQGKNRSGSNWFALSLPLGPLATFLLVISEKK